MHSLLESYSLLSPLMGYFLVFLGVAIEGDIVLFTSAFLAYQGVLDLGAVLLAAFGAVLLRDTLWYRLGAHMRKHPHLIGNWAANIAEPFDEHLIQRPLHSLFIAKFIYGLHLAVIIRAGVVRIPFRQFIRADICAALVWMALVGGLGYISSASSLAIGRYLKYTEVALLLGIVAYLVVHRKLARYGTRSLAPYKR